MTAFLTWLMFGFVAITVAMVVFLFIGKSLYDKLNANFVMNTMVVMLIMVLGFRVGRADMFIDIALSYAILGFISTVVLAKYIGGRRS